MLLEIVLIGDRDNTDPLPDLEVLIACVISLNLPLHKEANSLQALVDKCSEATGTGEFVSLLTVANKTRALLLFLVIISEKKACLAFFSSKLYIEASLYRYHSEPGELFFTVAVQLFDTLFFLF